MCLAQKDRKTAPARPASGGKAGKADSKDMKAVFAGMTAKKKDRKK